LEWDPENPRQKVTGGGKGSFARIVEEQLSKMTREDEPPTSQTIRAALSDAYKEITGG
jgi:hypothetical protein